MGNLLFLPERCLPKKSHLILGKDYETVGYTKRCPECRSDRTFYTDYYQAWECMLCGKLFEPMVATPTINPDGSLNMDSAIDWLEGSKFWPGSFNPDHTIKPHYGYRYHCQKCQYVTVFISPYDIEEWICASCKNLLTEESITSIFLDPIIPKVTYTGPIYISERERKRGRHRGDKSTSKVHTSYPVVTNGETHPGGNIPLEIVCQRLQMEGKRLRAWLRRSGWRSADTAGSRWTFTPEQVEELVIRFKGEIK